MEESALLGPQFAYQEAYHGNPYRHREKQITIKGPTIYSKDCHWCEVGQPGGQQYDQRRPFSPPERAEIECSGNSDQGCLE